MKLFMVNEDDLKTLEELLPQLTERLASLDFELHGKTHQNELRIKARRLKEVVTNIRWDYGPSTIEEQIPAGDES